MEMTSEEADKRRQTKLNSIRRQVKRGSLVVRQMTPEERAKHSVPEPQVKGDQR
jgi:hypothetical protein